MDSCLPSPQFKILYLKFNFIHGFTYPSLRPISLHQLPDSYVYMSPSAASPSSPWGSKLALNFNFSQLFQPWSSLHQFSRRISKSQLPPVAPSMSFCRQMQCFLFYYYFLLYRRISTTIKQRYPPALRHGKHFDGISWGASASHFHCQFSLSSNRNLVGPTISEVQQQEAARCCVILWGIVHLLAPKCIQNLHTRMQRKTPHRIE